MKIKSSDLKSIFGNSTAQIVLMHLYQLEEVWPQLIANESKASLTPIRKQLQRFANGQILKTKTRGKTILYSFNDKSPITIHLKNILKEVELSGYEIKSFEKKKNFLKSEE